MGKLILSVLIIIAFGCKKNVALNTPNTCCFGSSNHFGAYIKKGTATATISDNIPYFYKYQSADSSYIVMKGDNNNSASINIELKNIFDTGTYYFGKLPVVEKEAKIKCSYLGELFYNDSTKLSGFMHIDSLRVISGLIKLVGTFTVNCYNGPDSVKITNGNFTILF